MTTPPPDNPNASRDQLQRLALDDEKVVQLVLQLTKPGEDEFRSRRVRYDHSYETYRASERRPRSLEPWQSRLRVPYAMQVIDTALVNIVTGRPRCMVKPRHPEVELNAKCMQAVMDYYIGEDHLVEKMPLFSQQGLIFGVTIAKNHWLYQRSGRMRRFFGAGLPPAGQVGTEDMVLRDGPTFEPWSVYDCWWDGAGRDVDSARYVVLRSWLSKEQLLAQQCTVKGQHDKSECDGVFHNVEALFKVGDTAVPQATAQQRFLGGSQNFERNRGLFEILEVWTDDTVTVIGSRKVLLRNDPNPFWHGRKPIVIAQTRPDLFELQGIPETELVDHLQQAQWTLQNMVIDNLHLTVMRGVTYREGGVTDPNAIQLRPRFKWPVNDHDDIRPFEVQPVASDVFQERQRLLSDMQLVTGINPYVSGSDLSTVDQNTATGVTALQEVASRLLRFKAGQLQYKGYQRMYEQWGDMIQQFLDKPLAVQITGQLGEQAWVNISPQMVSGHFNYVLEGSEESLSRQQERGEAIALLNAMAPLAQLGFINFKPLLERVALSYDFPNPESLFMPPQTPPAAAPTQEQLDAQQGPQSQQAAVGHGGVLPGVLDPRIGDVYGARSRPEQGMLPLDPQLAHALSMIRNF